MEAAGTAGRRAQFPEWRGPRARALVHPALADLEKFSSVIDCQEIVEVWFCAARRQGNAVSGAWSAIGLCEQLDNAFVRIPPIVTSVLCAVVLFGLTPPSVAAPIPVLELNLGLNYGRFMFRDWGYNFDFGFGFRASLMIGGVDLEGARAASSRAAAALC